ncbi:hypothetical protein, partial [Paraburkholderia sp. SIMBA_053]|uniref:hypothetical protein n=1 Tax=Paraburkholderia sp. SIMBA_053 TaxID=3085794 RepID=UPI00397D7715
LICHAVGTVVDIGISFFPPGIHDCRVPGYGRLRALQGCQSDCNLAGQNFVRGDPDDARQSTSQRAAFWSAVIRSRTKISPFHARVQCVPALI